MKVTVSNPNKRAFIAPNLVFNYQGYADHVHAEAPLLISPLTGHSGDPSFYFISRGCN